MYVYLCRQVRMIKDDVQNLQFEHQSCTLVMWNFSGALKQLCPDALSDGTNDFV